MTIARRRNAVRRPWAPLVAALCLATLPASQAAQASERGPARHAVLAAAESEARVIVKFRADSALMHAQSAPAGDARPQYAQSLSNRLGVPLTDGRVLGPRSQVLKGSGLSSRELADRLAVQSDVEYAVVDGRMRALAVVPNDPLYPPQTSVTPAVGQWYLRAPTSATIVDSTSVVSAINAQAAWGITLGSSSVTVAVLDTGVRADHPDLASKLWPGYDFINDTTTANDGDGRDADASDPGDYGCTNPSEPTSTWHGTQTAGLIGAATDNGVGMASVGRNVMLLPVRVLGRCGGFDSDIQAAMKWAAGVHVDGAADNAHPAKVINLSLGASGSCSPAYADVVAQLNGLGVVVVAAAGNDGVAVGTPANCAGVIGVAGVRHAGTKVGYSDLGPQIALAAPAGNCVNTSGACLFPLLTTSNSGTTTPVAGAAGATYTGGGSDASLGTSFSAPLVAGTAALMFSANPSLTPAQVRSALVSTARPFPSTGAAAGVTACTAPTSVAQGSECYCTTSTCGAGMLDTGAAVALVAVTTANISVSSSSVVAGASVTLDASGSRPSGTSSLVGYQWAITSGASSASFSSATNASTATLLTSAAGSVVVSLTVTDSAGHTATNSTTVVVTTPPVVTPTPAPSGGGGGAMHLGWLVAWFAAVIGLWRQRPRRSHA